MAPALARKVQLRANVWAWAQKGLRPWARLGSSEPLRFGATLPMVPFELLWGGNDQRVVQSLLADRQCAVTVKSARGLDAGRQAKPLKSLKLGRVNPWCRSTDKARKPFLVAIWRTAWAKPFVISW